MTGLGLDKGHLVFPNLLPETAGKQLPRLHMKEEAQALRGGARERRALGLGCSVWGLSPPSPSPVPPTHLCHQGQTPHTNPG